MIVKPYAWKRLALMAALPMALGLASCTPPPSNTGGGATNSGGTGPAADSTFASARKAEGPVAVRIITNNNDPFWVSMEAGMTQAQGELEGCEATRVGPEPAENSKQRQLLEQAVSGGADGIAISVIQPDAIGPELDRVVEKGIPVITMDSDAPKSKRLVYIGTDNYNAGRAAGEAALKLLPQGGKFVAFVGNLSADNAKERKRGFEEATQGKIQILETFEDKIDRSRARKNVEDAITRFGDQINGFLGLYAYNGPAIADAVKERGIRNKVKIVCFDATEDAIKHLEGGMIDATIVQKPYEFGRLSTKVLYLINRKGLAAASEEVAKEGFKVNRNIIDTGVRTITPENVKPFREELKKLGVRSS